MRDWQGPEERARGLGIPEDATVWAVTSDRGGGWVQESIAVEVDGKPEPCPWPWLQIRDPEGEIVAHGQVWQVIVAHEPSGFSLTRRWRPELGEGREWIAQSPDGSFPLLGTARGLLRHPGRPPKVRGPEQVRAAREQLTRAAGRAPTVKELARKLDMTRRTLEERLERWPKAR